MNEMNQAHRAVNIDIDRLIIDGKHLTQQECLLLQKTVQTTLRDLFTQQGIPERISSATSAARVPGGDIHLTGSAVEPASLGQQIASSIYSGLGKG